MKLSEKLGKWSVELFERSLDYPLDDPETILDEYYFQSSELGEDFVGLSREVLEILLQYSTAENKEELLKRLCKVLLSKKNRGFAPYLPFVAFWKTKDFSFSIFEGSLLSEEQKINVLRTLVEGYIETRLRHLPQNSRLQEIIFKCAGQALLDAGSSRSQGNSAAKKLRSMLEETLSLDSLKITNSLEYFLNPEKGRVVATFLDRDSSLSNEEKTSRKKSRPQKREATNNTDNYESLLKKLARFLKHPRLNSKDTDSKRPDFVIRIGAVLLIGEAKHIKEGGGAQDKSLKELVKFIDSPPEVIESPFVSGSNKLYVHYVSYLDGLYFMKIRSSRDQKSVNLTKANKRNEYLEIKEMLEKNRGNFYVNSFGFRKLIDLIYRESNSSGGTNP